ncbi:hypothetical protein G6F40_016384 [Rhizopus arrhizus]|nr:hypothetical protein G6F40_016384 [Rhizopus arrhizus]
MSGAVGVIYQQFSLSLAVSILFSGFLALTFTPALIFRLVQPQLQPPDRPLRGAEHAAGQAHRPLHGDLRGDRGGAGRAVRARTGIVRAAGRPGLCDCRRPVAARGHPHPHRQGCGGRRAAPDVAGRDG